jgi:tRNA(Arg) A34 adenosine deaminase TadA
MMVTTTLLNTMDEMKYTLTAICKDKRGRTLAVATNTYTKTHPVQKQYSCKHGEPDKAFLHAEFAAILKASRLYKSASIHSIHVERFSTTGVPLNAKPCPICQDFIAANGIKQVTYTHSRTRIGSIT